MVVCYTKDIFTNILSVALLVSLIMNEILLVFRAGVQLDPNPLVVASQFLADHLSSSGLIVTGKGVFGKRNLTVTENKQNPKIAPMGAHEASKITSAVPAPPTALSIESVAMRITMPTSLLLPSLIVTVPPECFIRSEYKYSQNG